MEFTLRLKSAQHIHTIAGACFTPQPLARELALQMTGPRIIDRCAGNGALAFVTG